MALRCVIRHLRTHFIADDTVPRKSCEKAHTTSILYEKKSCTESSPLASPVKTHSKCRRMANDASVCFFSAAASASASRVAASSRSSSSTTARGVCTGGNDDDDVSLVCARAASFESVASAMGVVTCDIFFSARLAASFARARDMYLTFAPTRVRMEMGEAFMIARAFARHPSSTPFKCPHTAHTAARKSAACAASSLDVSASSSFVAKFTIGAKISPTFESASGAITPSSRTTPRRTT